MRPVHQGLLQQRVSRLAQAKQTRPGQAARRQPQQRKQLADQTRRDETQASRSASPMPDEQARVQSAPEQGRVVEYFDERGVLRVLQQVLLQ